MIKIHLGNDVDFNDIFKRDMEYMFLQLDEKNFVKALKFADFVYRKNNFRTIEKLTKPLEIEEYQKIDIYLDDENNKNILIIIDEEDAENFRSKLKNKELAMQILCLKYAKNYKQTYDFIKQSRSINEDDYQCDYERYLNEHI